MTNYLIAIISSLLLACGTLVIGVQNPIHSILFLVLVFFNGSIILMMLHVEFFALIFLIVYVGAIVILFLFMVMMLKIKHVNVSQKLLDFFPYASFIIGIFLLELLAYNKYLGLSSFNNLFLTAFPLNWNDTIFSLAGGESNIESLGKILYSTYLFPFLEAGLILFLAMVGAIVIALDSDNANKDVIKKQQDPINQMVRNSENAIYFSLPNAVKYNKNKTRLQLSSYAKLWQKLS
jgi:NADH-quinone oxidoreductase subunit J